ncbi:MAG: YhbY family RNA-binding protein [Ruminococcus sp.]|nr:YhbY family RNA-binding protein [Ruminococcus sp.]
MLTSKQRAKLGSLANSIDSTFQVGKSGVNTEQISQIDDYLRVHEIVKITVLESSLLTAREAAEEIAEEISAEVVKCIGSKAIIYKRNPKEPKIKI